MNRKVLSSFICCLALTLNSHAGPTADAVLREAKYVGRLDADSAVFQAQYDIEVLDATQPAKVRLIAGNVALSTSKTSSKSARIVRSNRAIDAEILSAGRFKITLDFVVGIEKSQETWKALAFNIGPAVVNRIEASTPGADSKIEFLSGATESLKQVKDGMLLAGYPGSSNEIKLRWLPKVKETKIKPVILCDSHHLVEVSTSVMRINSRLVYEVPQGEAATLEAMIPEALTVVRVSGDNIRDWSLKKSGKFQLCAVELLKPVTGKYTLDVLTELPLPQLPATVALPAVQAGSVERQGGTVGIIATDVSVEPARTDGMNRINPDAFVALGNWTEKQQIPESAFRFSRPDHQCELKLASISPEISAEEDISVFIGEQRTRMTVPVSLNITRAGLFSLRFSVPEGFTVTDVTAPSVDTWNVTGEKEQKALDVVFNRKLTGKAFLTISLEQIYTTAPETMSITGIKLAGATAERGTVAVIADQGIALKQSSALAIAPVPVASLRQRSGAEALAYRFNSPDWNVSISTAPVESHIAARIFNLVTIGDSSMAGTASIGYEIENSGQREFVVQLPETWQNVDFTGADIRQKTQEDAQTWRITLQDRVVGKYMLLVSYDRAFTAADLPLFLTGPKTVGTAEESGYLVIGAASHLEIAEAKPARGMGRIDVREVPEQYRSLIDNPAILAYSYARQPFNARISVNRHTTQEPLEAVADRATIVTVLTKSGRRETHATYLVKNNTRDMMSVLLPEGAQLLSAFVDGSASKPQVDQGRILIPLRKSTDRDRVFPVEFTYMENSSPLRRFFWNRISLSSPTPDIHASYAEWEVYAPSWLVLHQSSGSMKLAPEFLYTAGGELARAGSAWMQILSATWGLLLCVIAGILIVILLVKSARARKWKHFIAGIALVLLLAFVAVISVATVSTRGRHKVTAGDAAANWLQGAAPTAPVVEEPASVPNPSGHAMATGLLPIRIELPKEGRMWRFTKVLNVDNEPLAIHSRATPNEIGNVLAYMLAILMLFFAARLARSGIRDSAMGHVAIAAMLVFSAGWAIAFAHNALFAYLMASPMVLAVTTVVGLIMARPPKQPQDVPPPMPDEPANGSGTAAGTALLAMFGMFLATCSAFGGEVRADGADQRAGVIADSGEFLPETPDLSEGVAAEPPARPNPEVTWSQYKGNIAGKLAEFEGTISICLPDPVDPDESTDWEDDPVALHLLGTDVALRSWKIDGRGANLVPYEKGYQVLLPRPGQYSITLKFIAVAQGDETKRHLRFNVPESAACTVKCTLKEKEATVESATAVSVKRETIGDQTVATLYIGAAPVVDLTWVPRVKEAREMKVSAYCSASTLATVDEGAINLLTMLRYEVTQGEMSKARMEVPDSLRLLSVTGPNVMSWELQSADGKQVLSVDLKSPAAASDPITVNSEMTLAQLPCSIGIPLPSPLDVQRASGDFGIISSEDIVTEVAKSSGMHKIDPSDFTRSFSGDKAAVSPAYAFRYRDASFKIELSLKKMEPDIRVAVAERYTIGNDEDRLEARLDYDIRKAGVFRLEMELPGGFNVESVNGDSIRDWRVTDNKEPRVMSILFDRKMRGKLGMELTMTRAKSAFSPTNEVPGIVPLGTGECSGYLGIATAFGITINRQDSENLTAVPVAELPQAKRSDVSLGFRYTEPNWKLAVIAGKSQSWLQADGTHVITIGDNRLSVETTYTYSIENAPVDSFVVLVPVEARNVKIEGDDIREQDQKDQKWSIRLQDKVKGTYRLVIRFDVPLQPDAKSADMPFVHTVGTERDSGHIIICSAASLHLKETGRSAETVMPVDTREVTKFVPQVPADNLKLAYRYLRPDRTLSVSLNRFEAADVLQAITEKARLTTVLAEDGQYMTQANLSVRNNARQRLEVRLPANSTVWSCFVGGKAVRVSTQDQKVLLPLMQSDPTQPAFEVELTYISKRPPLSKRRRIQFEAPGLDVPIHDMRWDVYLPESYAYDDFGGTMEPLKEAAGQFNSFDIRQYTETLNAQMFARRASAENLRRSYRDNLANGSVSTARRQLEEAQQFGDETIQKELDADLGRIEVAEANAQAMMNYGGGEKMKSPDARGKTGKIEMKLHRQIEHPKSSVATSTPQLSAMPQDDSGARPTTVAFDRMSGSDKPADIEGPAEESKKDESYIRAEYVSAALEQNRKIRKAQTVSEDKVTPLRLSLPVRGIKYSFSQAIWMPSDKPITARMHAHKSERLGFWKMLVTVILGYAAIGFFLDSWKTHRRLRLLAGALLTAFVYALLVIW